MGLSYQHYFQVNLILFAQAILLSELKPHYTLRRGTMINPETVRYTSLFSAFRRHLVKGLMLMALLSSVIYGQTQSSDPFNGTTPAGLAPGAPAGAFPLSGFENVNLFSGNLNFNLPILKIGGRGSAQYSVSVTIDRPQWRIETITDEGLTSYAPAVDAWHPFRTGTAFHFSYAPGLLVGRATGELWGSCTDRYKSILSHM